MSTRRTEIEVDGFAHGDLPIPTAVRIDNWVFSSGIHPLDPATGSIPEDPTLQVELVFRHMRAIVENAGGHTDDIAQVIFHLNGEEHRHIVMEEWLRMFPSAPRPARNTVITDLGFGMVIHVLMTAVLAR